MASTARGATVSEGLCDAFWLQGMSAGIKPAYDCIEQFSATDFTENLKKIDVPTLIVHGDDDRIVPIETSAKRSVQLVPNATLKVCPGGAHGLAQLEVERFNSDLLHFIEG
ncbi:alpha/beta fold hydrolase [Azotobacter beijerinckii]|uniref:alpha/beta fold hydrolase n=1 Tax=Azotobacter beijerinckii TaxID=170623 RepID=UPI002955A866|nr:alpha/beta hydrolase [Azotobacter beijerinckii]MDV7213016.1 alpha/beta hydrolase [Azotobacter beijerinckii]